MQSIFLLKIVSIILLLAVTLLAGFYPFYKKLQAKDITFSSGESLAAGVFLGAGLIHMLADAHTAFLNLHINYPLASLLCGSVFLLFLLLEHVGRELYSHQEDGKSFAILATVMLSIHSLFAGAALGIGTSPSIVLVILLAILAHKWVASFSLAVYITKGKLSPKAGIALFLVFALMAPLGIVLPLMGHNLHFPPYILPTFSAIAAGTFLYLGTLHGLEKAILIKNCCDLRRFFYVVLGFCIMALVALWT